MQLYWPESGGWFDGYITEYNPAKDEHTVVYNIDTPEEEVEYINLAEVERKPELFRWAAGPAYAFPPGSKFLAASAPPALAARPKSSGRPLTVAEEIQRASNPAKVDAVVAAIEEKARCFAFVLVLRIETLTRGCRTRCCGSSWRSSSRATRRRTGGWGRVLPLPARSEGDG